MADGAASPVRDISRRTMEIRQVDVYGSTIRVAIWPGDREKTPLLMFNGIGASLELLVPFADALGDIETIAFDVPGTGKSSQPLMPYRLWMLSMLASRLLGKLGYDQVDVLGVSWGGAFAQQFALQNPKRCRRLVLAATAQGFPMMPGKLSVLAKFFTPRRFNDPEYLSAIAGEIYGGQARDGKVSIQEFRRTSKRGYLMQQMALLGWTSVPWLPLLPSTDAGHGGRRRSRDSVAQRQADGRIDPQQPFTRVPRRASFSDFQCDRSRPRRSRFPCRPRRDTDMNRPDGKIAHHFGLGPGYRVAVSGGFMF